MPSLAENSPTPDPVRRHHEANLQRECCSVIRLRIWPLPLILFLALLVLVRLPAHAQNDNTLEQGHATADAAPLTIAVIDPLAKQLACDCVAGYAQRDYERLADYLQTRLKRPVQIAFGEAISDRRLGRIEDIDIVIGKYSVVMFDARQTGLSLRSLAMLTDQQGSILQTGLFVVHHDSEAQSIEDLAGCHILFGHDDSDEKRSAAFATLEAFGVPLPPKIESKASCSTAALAVAEKDADACVVSSYAMPLLEGCGTIAKGELRIVGITDPVPFIGVFASQRVAPQLEQQVCRALREVRKDANLLAALESKRGFVDLPSIATATWSDWRGPGRQAAGCKLPNNLPAQKQLLWSRTLTGSAMSGLAVADGFLVVADKDYEETHDIFRCLHADTGRQAWSISYPAAGEMDYTNSPRANPVIHDGLVYLLGAFGDLHCVSLETGRIVWQKHLARDFSTTRPQWGYCSAPVIVDDLLIINPGASNASLVALDRRTGALKWRSAGRAPGYSCFISANLGGVQQIVGYDATSLGGWNPSTGERLWELLPPIEGDFNVPTPILFEDKILVTTENNGTRLYGFHKGGRINSEPLAVNEDLAPDTATPVVCGQQLFANHRGLMCLNITKGLKTEWEADDEPLCDYSTLIAGNGRVLVTTQSGKLYLLNAGTQRFTCAAQLELFDDVPLEDRDVWSHPALVGNRIYIRNNLAVYCFLLNAPVSQ